MGFNCIGVRFCGMKRREVPFGARVQLHPKL